MNLNPIRIASQALNSLAFRAPSDAASRLGRPSIMDMPFTPPLQFPDGAVLPKGPLPANPLQLPQQIMDLLGLGAGLLDGAGATGQAQANGEAGGATSLLEQVLGRGKGPVSEEHLFAAATFERLHSQVGPDAAKQFQRLLRDGLQGDNPNFEQATLQALRQLVEQGVITPEQGDQIYSQAFAAAQLDDKLGQLFDGRGGPGDDTIATAPRREALAQALERLSDFDRGVTQPRERSLRGARATGRAGGGQAAGHAAGHGGQAVGGPAGFLWKPQSESNGKLVVLLPSELGQAESVVIRDRNGNVLERGDYSGIHNGDRAHYRFDRAGGNYPPGVTLEAQMPDGRTVRYPISTPGQRVES